MKKRCPRTVVVFGILWLLMAVVAKADTALPSLGFVEMLEGQGVEVCEACLKAMEAIASEAGAVGLSGCERNYASEYGFSAPQWKELPPLKHLSILKKVMLFLRPGDPEFAGTGRSTMLEGTIYETDDIFRREIKTELKYERIAVSMATIDVDNDGRPEPLFRYRQGDCPNPNVVPLRVRWLPHVRLLC